MVPVYGLILAGGESRRMGQDKGDIRYHGQSQRRHLAALLAPHCDQVFIACRPDQRARIEPELACLLDPAPDLGPLAGLAAAFAHRPDAAWLVVACDLPWLDAPALGALVAGRGPRHDAVAFQAADGGPEPMAALWEPALGPAVHAAVAAGHLSVRDRLRAARCHLLPRPATEVLFDANTPQARAAALRRRQQP